MPARRPPQGPAQDRGPRGAQGRLRARRTAPPDPAQGPRLTSRALVLGLVLLVLVISYASSLRAWLDQRQRIAEAEQQIAVTGDAIDALERERRRWTDDAYVQQQARARLGYVLPGETGYRVITADGDPLGIQPAPTPADHVEPREWYDTLWASTRRAGREP